VGLRIHRAEGDAGWEVESAGEGGKFLFGDGVMGNEDVDGWQVVDDGWMDRSDGIGVGWWWWMSEGDT
jgi:hypothetical protein